MAAKGTGTFQEVLFGRLSAQGLARDSEKKRRILKRCGKKSIRRNCRPSRRVLTRP